ncbi:MAG TPA: YetF domain-containing protein, partial [Dyadobacter sp.]|nr:YetF domain-containing protein [Dyadobacter sp.]
METLTQLFGERENQTALQMSARAVVIFIITLILLRIAGRRSFGMKSPFDNIIVILLGAILSRAVVGASEFVPTIASATVIAVLHRLGAWLGALNLRFGALIKGQKIVLFEKGKLKHDNMRRALISESDLYASLRNDMHVESFEKIESAYMENNGQISF